MEKAETMRIGAAYIRVSTEEQAEYSPESQLAEIRKYAAAHGITVPDTLVFLDEGISGRTTSKRPAFRRMIGTAKCKPCPFQVLLLWKFSRFARNREDSIVYKSMLRRECGVEVVSVSEPMSDDKMSIILEAMIEAMDEYYSLNLAQEVRRGMTQRAAEGRHNTYAPFGYLISGGRYVPHPENAPIVRKIFSDFLTGKGMLAIAREVSALGIRTRFGNPFEARTVQYILRNPVYIGKLHWTPSGRTRRVWDNPDTLTVDGGFEPLLTPEQFVQVQHLLDTFKARYGAHGRQDGLPFPLKGLVKCSCCGSTLVRMNRGDKAGLQCAKYRKGLCPESHYVGLEALTAAVLGQIYADFPGLTLSLRPGNAIEPPPLCDTKEALTQQLAREEQRLARIRAAYEAGADTLAEYTARKQHLLMQMERLRRQLEDAAATPVDAPSIQPSVSHPLMLDDMQKNMLLRAIVRQIIFCRASGEVILQYAE